MVQVANRLQIIAQIDDKRNTTGSFDGAQVRWTHSLQITPIGTVADRHCGNADQRTELSIHRCSIWLCGATLTVMIATALYKRSKEMLPARINGCLQGFRMALHANDKGRPFTL
jgi:hypothetical protein